MIDTSAFLKEVVGTITMTRLPADINPFPGELEMWLIRTDLIRRGVSIKVFPAVSTVAHAQQSNAFKGKDTVVVSSSANFAIAMAMVLQGQLKLIAIVPPSIADVKKERLKRQGVEVVERATGAIELANEYAKNPNVVHLDQYSDRSMTTEVERYLAPDVRRQVDYTHVLTPLGTGGTGIGFALSHKNSGIQASVVGINLLPGSENKVSGMRDPKRQEEVQLPWRQALAADPISVGRAACDEWAERLREKGIMVGTSSGAPLAALGYFMEFPYVAAMRREGKKITVVMPCPDSTYAFE